MKVSLHLAIGIAMVLLMCGCGESTSQTKQSVSKENRIADAQAVPEIFKSQLVKFLEAGEKLSAKSSQGISILELNDQLANAKTAYTLLVSMWPTTLSTDSRIDFEKAINGWGLTFAMWKLKVDQQFPVTEIDGNDYSKFVDYAGDKLVVNVYGNDAYYKEQRGKKFLPQMQNVSVLLKIANTSFDQGRDKILPVLR